MAKKKNDAEKLNMALSLHYLHGLSNKQVTRITGLHYKTVESYLAKLERQLASGELSTDDIMASAESANKRLGIEALIAKDGGAIIENDTNELLEESNHERLQEKGVEHDIWGVLKEKKSSTGETIGDMTDKVNGYVSAAGRILRDNVNRRYPKNDKKEATIDCDLPEDFQNSFRELMDTRCTDHYAAVALQSLIDRIRSKSIVVTCLSVSEEDFSNLSINWKRVSPLKKEARQ